MSETSTIGDATSKLPPQPYVHNPETRVQRIQRERAEQQNGNRTAKSLRPVNATELAKLLNEALSKYGEETYYDRGSSDVLDLKPIIARLEGMNAIVIHQVFVELYETLGERKAQPLLTALVHSLDERDDFDEIIADDRLGDLY